VISAAGIGGAVGEGFWNLMRWGGWGGGGPAACGLLGDGVVVDFLDGGGGSATLVLAMRRSSWSSFLVWGSVLPSAGKSEEVALKVFCGSGVSDGRF